MLQKLLKAFIICSFIFLNACSLNKAPAPKAPIVSSTFVLVHGALFTSAGWGLTPQILNSLGQNVVTLDVPGRAGDKINPKKIDIKVAAAKVCEVAKAQSGKVILVGHSQGGALINQAMNECGDKVQALVYVAAVVPLHGESAFQGLDPKADTGWGKVTIADKKAGLFKVNKKGPVHEIFFADVSDENAQKLIDGMVSEPMGIGTTKLTVMNEQILSVPRYFIETTEDKVISVASQRKFQARIPGTKVFSMHTSHCPFASQPVKFSNYLAEVSEETHK